MHPLSVAIVTFNEEDRIGQCLESVRFADELIVVDSFSTDRTLDVCRKYTDKLFQREWQGWKDQKSWAAQQCSNEWVLTLDADEVVSGELALEIVDLLTRPEIKENGFVIPRRNYYFGKLIKHGAWGSDSTLRLYRKSLARFGGYDPHEVIEVEGGTGRLKGHILHNSYRDLAHQVSQLSRYARVSAQEHQRDGKRAGFMDFAFRPGFTFLKEYVFKQGLRDGVPGFIIACMDSYYTFLKYAWLWSLSRERSESGGLD